MGINEYVKIGSLIKELRLSKGYTAKEFSIRHIPITKIIIENLILMFLTKSAKTWMLQ